MQRYKKLIRYHFERLRIGSALIDRLKRPYHFRDFVSDILAGLVVSLVALPLGMALAIASGVAPQYGLYTVIVGGFLVALLGGSQCQVTGPTAAFVVILLPIVHKFGLQGLLIAGFMAGFILLAMGLSRMGRLIQFMPYPVTTGFTAGIGIVIATLQLKDFFGLQIPKASDNYFNNVKQLFLAAPTFSIGDSVLGLITLGILVFWPKLTRKVPSPLIGLSFAAVLALFLKKFWPDLHIATIGTRFHYDIGGVQGSGIPQLPPYFHLPWSYGTPPLSFETFKTLLPSAFAIALLGAIESLLSAVVADGLSKTQHDPDGELVALGIGNIVVPFFSGIPATGAIARTSTNIRFGATSPFASMAHALCVFLAVLAFAPLLSYLPMASIAALLILIAYHMSDFRHFIHVMRVAPRSDVAVLLTCTLLTVSFDMVVGVIAGIVLSAFLFMGRMMSITSVTPLTHAPESKAKIPEGILLYKISGPLFYGTSQKAIAAISQWAEGVHTVFFDLTDVPTMDVTALVVLEASVSKLKQHGKNSLLIGLQKQPHQVVNKSEALLKDAKIFRSIEEASQFVQTRAA